MLSILLQKSDPYHPWGFTVTGGRDVGFQIAIDKVTPGTLASRYLAPGDKLIKIDDLDTSHLRQSEAALIIARPTTSMDLLVLKCDDISDTAEMSASRKSRYSDSNRAREQVQNERECSLRERKRIFWDNCSRDDTDYSKGFSRLSKFVNGPVKDRMSRKEEWRRCVSEDRSDDSFSPQSSNIHELPSRPARRACSPSPSQNQQFRFRSDSGSNAVDSLYNTTESGSSLNQSYKVSYEPPKPGPFSPRSDHCSEMSSPLTPNSNPFNSRTSFSFSPSRLKKPSDFWGEHLHQNGSRRTTSSVPRTSNCFWNNLDANKKSSTFKRSVSLSESYSTSDGPKAFEKTEKRNEIEVVENLCKNGKEERYEKSEKGKEVVIRENDDVGESRHVVNDFHSVERTIGEAETYNTIKTHSEEKMRSATPPGFYDNARQNVQVKEALRSSPCSHKVEVESLVSLSSVNENKSEKEVNIGVKTKDIFSADSANKFASSTPLPPVDDQRLPAVNQKNNVAERVDGKHKDEQKRQQNQISGGGGSPEPGFPQSDTGVVAPPPPLPPPSVCPPAPPPPPPPGSGVLPSVRLSSEIPDRKKGGYEPPAAIQNAMMTKDKKPFTYTPGGLDLSEIRSPRMARRITRNANAPDSAVPQPRPSPLANQPLPPSAMAAMQPQIAIPVFPQGGGGPPQLHHVGAPGGFGSAPPPPPPPGQSNSPQTSPPVMKTQSTPPPPPPPVYNQPSPPAMQKSPQATYSQPSPPPMSVPKSQPQNRQHKQETQPGSIYIPPIESQQPRVQLGSLYIPPIAQEEVKQAVQSPVQLNKAPTPWLSRSQSQREKEVPPWVNREENIPSQPTSQPLSNQAQTRIIPIQIEGREQSSTPTNTRIIPIHFEGSNSPVQNKQPNFQRQQQQSTYQQSPVPTNYQQQQQWQQQPQQQQQRWTNQQPIYVHNKFNTGSQSPAPASNDQIDNPKLLQTQQSWGQTAANGTAPVQSRSFKVLQKITDTADGGVDQTDAPYNSQGVPLSQLRKLQLSDDDRALMNKVKTQVDEETYLHNESDPRYRGSSIPSRAFRMLQTMTGEGDGMEVPRSSPQNHMGQNRLGQVQQQTESPQPYIPPSEQQVQEPRKYTGSAIPSRSFRMLQAMTAGSDSSDRPGESEY